MMSYGKRIVLFLLKGTTEDLVTAELSNWDGKAIKLPRTEVLTCKREDVKGTGVYFLFGIDEKGSEGVYIGEGENIIDRLKQHLRNYTNGTEKYYWNTAVIFTGRDLNKAFARYMEDRLVKMAKECGAYHIFTERTYKTSVTESEIAMLEEFMENIRILIGVLGYKVLEAAPKAEEDTVYLYCKGSGGEAKGFLSSRGLTVLKGSRVSQSMQQSLKDYNPGYYNLRNKLATDGTIQDDVFQFDYEFESPTAAAAVVVGHPVNGNTAWKTDAEVSLKDLDASNT